MHRPPSLFLAFLVAVNLCFAESGGSRAGRGLSYQHDSLPEGPWSVHVARLERTNADYELTTTLGRGTIVDLSRLSEQVKEIPTRLGKAMAGVNGDFYHNEPGLYQGDPFGLQIIEGELVSAPCERSCFWLDAARQPHMTNVESRFHVTWPDGTETPFGLNEKRTDNGAVLYTSILALSTRTKGGREIVLERNGTDPWLPLRANQTLSARVRQVRETGDTQLESDILVLSVGPERLNRIPQVKKGDVLKLTTETIPDLGGASVAIGGGPALVREGKPMTWRPPQVRHPRAAFGWNDQYFFLVEVDGRQRGLSVGMTFPEFADYLAKLGCTEALNLDGGGSATFWFMGQMMNSPSEGKEREIGNAIVVVRKKTPPVETPTTTTPSTRDD